MIISAEIVTSKIKEFCKLTITNKIITVRPLDPPWMNKVMRTFIRKIKRIHKHAKSEHTKQLEKISKTHKKYLCSEGCKHEYKIKLLEKIHQGNFRAKIGGKQYNFY